MVVHVHVDVDLTGHRRHYSLLVPIEAQKRTDADAVAVAVAGPEKVQQADEVGVQTR